MRTNVVLTLFTALVIGLAPAAAAQVEIEQRGNPPLGPVNPVAFDEVVALASQLLNGFWNDVFAKEGLFYQIPAGFYWYNERLMTHCGPTSANNAFFCPADRTIWFHYDFLLALYNNIGDYAAAHVLAHEWGHWVQYLLGIDNRGYTIFTELQADCFAGVFAAFADSHGYLDEGDIEEAVIIAYNVGDPKTMPWYEPGAHGTSQQRVTAFVLGFGQGLYSCNFENMTNIIQSQSSGTKAPARPQPQFVPQPEPLTVTPLMQGGNAYGLDIRANADVQSITLEVFDTAGQRVYADTSRSGALRYHGLDNNGQRLANGLYLYAITVHKLDGAVTRSQVKKLAILR